jgi:hypothetical protein
MNERNASPFHWNGFHGAQICPTSNHPEPLARKHLPLIAIKNTCLFLAHGVMNSRQTCLTRLSSQMGYSED